MEAVRDAQLFLEGRHGELERRSPAHGRGRAARAVRARRQIPRPAHHHHQLQEKQRIATAENDDADVFGYHYEDGMLP